MAGVRVIPALLLRGRGLVKTVKFQDPKYVGDPINAVRIFNDKQVDELVFLDISATPESRGPAFDLIADIAAEAFMPFGYGGGVTSLEQARRLVALGVEKVVLNSEAVARPELVTELAQQLGSQSVVVSIDVRRSFLGKYEVVTRGATQRTGLDPVAWARRMQQAGAGELIVNAVDRDGTMSGYDVDLVGRVSGAVEVPVVACGGAGSLADFRCAVGAGAAAVAAGSMFVFHGKHRAVLITYPTPEELGRLSQEVGR